MHPRSSLWGSVHISLIFSFKSMKDVLETDHVNPQRGSNYSYIVCFCDFGEPKELLKGKFKELEVIKFSWE